jgi:hypothetical protein
MKALGWDPSLDNDILDEVDLEDDQQYLGTDTDDNEPSSSNPTTVKKVSAKPENIMLSYDWNYGQKGDFWKWFLEWFDD